jgi:hypothetical protein
VPYGFIEGGKAGATAAACDRAAADDFVYDQPCNPGTVGRVIITKSPGYAEGEFNVIFRGTTTDEEWARDYDWAKVRETPPPPVVQPSQHSQHTTAHTPQHTPQHTPSTRPECSTAQPTTRGGGG